MVAAPQGDPQVEEKARIFYTAWGKNTGEALYITPQRRASPGEIKKRADLYT